MQPGYGVRSPAPTSSCTAHGQPNREINIGGTANVLDAMAHSGTRRIVFASSAHVYGADQGGIPPRSETDRVNPVSAEGRDKAHVEEMLADLRCGMGGDPLGS